MAHTGDPDLPIVRWDNPFCPGEQGRGVQWHDDEIGVAGCIMSLVNAVRDSAHLWPVAGPAGSRDHSGYPPVVVGGGAIDSIATGSGRAKGIAFAPNRSTSSLLGIDCDLSLWYNVYDTGNDNGDLHEKPNVINLLGHGLLCLSRNA
jgi:hypothetical protein